MICWLIGHLPRWSHRERYQFTWTCDRCGKDLGVSEYQPNERLMRELDQQRLAQRGVTLWRAKRRA